MVDLPADYIPLARSEFGDFSTSVLEDALRSVPVKDRKDRRELIFLMSKSTYACYIGAIAGRLGSRADSYLLGMVGNATYAGIPVIESNELPDDIVEIYGPYKGENK